LGNKATRIFISWSSSNLCLVCATRSRRLSTLTICLGGIVSVDNNQILRAVIVLASEVRLENSLRAICVSLLSIEGCTGHVRNQGVSATEGVLCVSEDVVLGCGLREPDISSVAAEVTALQSVGNVFLNNDGPTSGVDEPRSCDS
jgi:hypothetical protein